MCFRPATPRSFAALLLLLGLIGVASPLSISPVSSSSKNTLLKSSDPAPQSSGSSSLGPQYQLASSTSTTTPALLTSSLAGQFQFGASSSTATVPASNRNSSDYARFQDESYATNYNNHNSHKSQVSQNQQQQDSSTSDSSNEDSIPLANNHSRKNLQLGRIPQYVDISALGSQRDRFASNHTNYASYNSSSANGNGVGVTGTTGNGQLDGHSSSGSASIQAVAPIPVSSSSSSSISGSAGLTAKSRSNLPECATQQVCNAIFVRMNFTQRLCECSSNYNWRCSNNLDPHDGHTIELTRKFDKRIYTQIKTCEPLREVRNCKSPTDWTLLALQSERSGKAHYVVACKCPTWAQLEGPYTHNHPPYANIPGIRVYGMLCASQTARSSAQSYSTYNPNLGAYPEFPWSEALNVANTTGLLSTLN